MSEPVEGPLDGRQTLRVLVVSEVRLFREGLARELERVEGIGCVEPLDAAGAVSGLAGFRADVILADPSTVRGTELVRRAAECGTAVVAFAVAEERDEEIVSCAEAGVAGIVARDASVAEVVAAARTAVRGDAACSPRASGVLLRRLARVAASRPIEPKAAALTRREREIAACIDRGLSNKEIAVALGIETATVKNHVHSLLEKLQARRRGQVPSILRCGADLADAAPEREARRI